MWEHNLMVKISNKRKLKTIFIISHLNAIPRTSHCSSSGKHCLLKLYTIYRNT